MNTVLGPDPDEMLAAARKALREWENALPLSAAAEEAAERVTSAFGALDDWLSNGGRPPADWVTDPAGGDHGLNHQ
jgi:hypothetical protein